MATTLTWLGHAAFRIDTPGGKRIYVDPFLTGNPKCPENELEPERVDAIFLTHGHDDHVGDTVALAQKFECPVVAQVELRVWLAGQGVELNMAHAPNKGGTVDVDGIKVTLTTGNHSSSARRRHVPRRVVRARLRARGRPQALLRRRHERLRRHGADRADLRAGRGRAADRRPLHDGPARGRCRARAARGEALRPVALRHLPAPHRHARKAARASAAGIEILAPEPGGAVEL